MTPSLDPNHERQVLPPSGWRQWLASRQARFVFLATAVFLSLPASFSELPEIGIDPSWKLSLQVASINDKVSGQEFIFTYGPLGYLLIHTAVSKAILIVYDVFILSSLLCIYRSLLPVRPERLDVFLLILLAIATKSCGWAGSSAVLFIILCHGLWQVCVRGHPLNVAGVFIAALALFFGKVNYGLITILLVPLYGMGLLALHQKRRVQGISLVVGFPILVFLGAAAWQVDLPNYLRSGIELVVGYNEAMFLYPKRTFFPLVLAGLLILAMVVTAFLGRRHLVWREQSMFLPLIGIATLLLFKNGFTRSDEEHNGAFFAALPLLLAVWCVGWRDRVELKILLLFGLIYPLGVLTSQTRISSLNELIELAPLRYCQQLVTTPGHEDTSRLQATLSRRYPEVILPEKIRATIGRSSVDVMPWESSIAVLNGLNYQARPIPQSYSAYTPWLDQQNANFLSSSNAPDYMIFARAQDAATDDRPGAWDESIAKKALVENYAFDSEFTLPMRIGRDEKLKPADVFLLKHSTHLRRLVPVATNSVSLALGESISIPATINLVFLTLEVDRSTWGKIVSGAWYPSLLTACFEYQDGTKADYRAVLPILKTGVLVNRRIESASEIRNWLEMKTTRNIGVSAISFKTSGPGSFAPPFKGFLVEYRVDETGMAPAVR